jgi:hypothetical protein
MRQSSGVALLRRHFSLDVGHLFMISSTPPATADQPHAGTDQTGAHLLVAEQIHGDRAEQRPGQKLLAAARRGQAVKSVARGVERQSSQAPPLPLAHDALFSSCPISALIE